MVQPKLMDHLLINVRSSGISACQLKIISDERNIPITSLLMSDNKVNKDLL
jgi:hypothetical protein